jgi:hypothetical protein
MKLIAFFLCGLILMKIQLSAQDMQFPKGAYMSFQEIISKSPSRQYNLIVERRTKGDIKMNGGNDFKLVSPDNSIAKSILKKEIWAYSLGDTLYLNGFQYKIQPWYADVISDGKYLVFKGGLSQYVDEQKRQMQMGYMFGAVGGAIQGAYLATLRFLYVIDKESNKIFTVTPEKMEELLKSNNELLVQFRNEVKKEDEALLIKYLKVLNENSNK